MEARLPRNRVQLAGRVGIAWAAVVAGGLLGNGHHLGDVAIGATVGAAIVYCFGLLLLPDRKASDDGSA